MSVQDVPGEPDEKVTPVFAFTEELELLQTHLTQARKQLVPPSSEKVDNKYKVTFL